MEHLLVFVVLSVLPVVLYASSTHRDGEENSTTGPVIGRAIPSKPKLLVPRKAATGNTALWASGFLEEGRDTAMARIDSSASAPSSSCSARPVSAPMAIPSSSSFRSAPKRAPSSSKRAPAAERAKSVPLPAMTFDFSGSASGLRPARYQVESPLTPIEQEEQAAVVEHLMEQARQNLMGLAVEGMTRNPSAQQAE